MSKSSPKRLYRLKLAALQALSEAHPYALPEAALRLEVDGQVRPPMDDGEFADLLIELETSTPPHIARLPVQMAEEPLRWVCTEAGQALLARRK